MSQSNNHGNGSGYRRSTEDDAVSLGAGGTTVFGDAAINMKDFDLNGSTAGKGKAGLAHGIPLEMDPGKTVKFGQSQDDYTAKNSALFFRIGDDGILPALHKLDSRLQSVSPCTFTIAICWRRHTHHWIIYRSIIRASFQNDLQFRGLDMKFNLVKSV